MCFNVTSFLPFTKYDRQNVPRNSKFGGANIDRVNEKCKFGAITRCKDKLELAILDKMTHYLSCCAVIEIYGMRKEFPRTDGISSYRIFFHRNYHLKSYLRISKKSNFFSLAICG